MIAPYTGGIDLYVSTLCKEIRKLGNEVEISGSIEGETAFDNIKKQFKSPQQVLDIANKIAERIEFGKYDIVAFHYGKNDIEMLLPTIIDKKKYANTKFIYYVHYLSRNLFLQYIPDKVIQNSIENAVYKFYDGYIFFGKFAQKFMMDKSLHELNGIVSFLPETHSQERHSCESRILESLIPDYKLVQDFCVVLPGFAANYKDYNLLLDSFRYIDNKLIFIFAGLGWRKRIPEDIQIDNVSVRVIEKYLSPLEYRIITNASLFGVFPYRQPEIEGEYFQGSGTVPNFIYAGKSTIVLNEGAMAEYVGDSGIIVEKNKPIELAKYIDILLSDKKRRHVLEMNAKKRAHLFSVSKHANDCISLFNALRK